MTSTQSLQAIQYCHFSTRRRFGVEIEVGNERTPEDIRAMIRRISSKDVKATTGWQQTNDNSYWHVKWDATCGTKGRGHDNGWEVASYIASGYRDITHIADVANHLRESGITINQNCGLHIHVEIQEFSVEQAAVLVARWIKLEPTIIQTVPLYRTKSKYCRLLSRIGAKIINFKKHYEAKDFWQLIRPTNYGVHDNTQKKVALNMVNYAATQKGHQNRSTVELRLPEGSLYGSDIRNWCRCFLNFVELSKTAKMPDELIPAADPLEELMVFFGLEDAEHFYILSKGLYEAKVWLLKRVIAYASKEIAEKAKIKLALCTSMKK